MRPAVQTIFHDRGASVAAGAADRAAVEVSLTQPLSLVRRERGFSLHLLANSALWLSTHGEKG